MKKIMNDPSQIVDEMVAGFVKTHDDLVELIPDTFAVKRKNQPDGKVALVSGGGSGHEPTHAGFVGQGMLSAAVFGQVFTSPTPDQIEAAIKGVDRGAGTLLIIKNYSGDVMNFEMAQEIAEMDDVKVEKVIVDDDIAVEDSTYTQGKRGVAGTVLVHKILGAAADQGTSLDDLKDLGEKVINNTKTIGVALTGATVPEVGKPGFTLPEDEIEYGVGIHGEPGYKREKLKTSKEMVHELLGKLKKAFDLKSGEKYGVLVNGMGGTPLMEQYVFMNDVLNELESLGVTVGFKKVGNYMTSLEMQGVSLTLIKLVDDKWIDYLEYPVVTPAW